MTRGGRRAIHSLAAACLGVFATLMPAAALEPLGKPYAIFVYADWCWNCKQILPRLDAVMPAYTDRIAFERFDVTNDEHKAQTRQRATELGLGPIYFANKGTGLVLLVNRQREKVGELRHTLSDQQIITALDALADGRPIPAIVADPSP